jgi:hypothetical protein
LAATGHLDTVRRVAVERYMPKKQAAAPVPKPVAKPVQAIAAQSAAVPGKDPDAISKRQAALYANPHPRPPRRS